MNLLNKNGSSSSIDNNEAREIEMVYTRIMKKRALRPQSFKFEILKHIKPPRKKDKFAKNTQHIIAARYVILKRCFYLTMLSLHCYRNGTRSGSKDSI